MAAAREAERSFATLKLNGVAFHHRFLGMNISDRRIDDVIRVAEEYGRTVFVHTICYSDFEEPWRLFALARRFPNVRFLALDGFSSHPQSEMLRDRASDFPNVWFDTACMVSVAHGIGEFIERCGAGRLVLGTNLYSRNSFFRIAFPIVEIQAMGLSSEEINAIFHLNIASLLEPSVNVQL
jgi:hypothetical protein